MILPKINLSDIQKTLRESYDLFICSSSYEERCLSVASNIDIDKVGRVLILSNKDLLEHVGLNQNRLVDRFGKKGQVVDLSTSDPLFTADNLSQSINMAMRDGCYGSILIDVTTFTHESLMILLRLLQLHPPTAKVTGIYANASEYSIGDDMRHKWLSRGVGEVRSILGFPGNIIPSRKTHLILIVGYEHERAVGIIETIEPHSIALGYGLSENATTENNRDANEHYMHLVEQMATSYADVNSFEVLCNNPHETRDKIQIQINKAEGMNILIAPMNNKLTTIGSTWAAFNNENIQMCYIRALRYNYLKYSRPGSQCYIFDLFNK